MTMDSPVVADLEGAQLRVGGSEALAGQTASAGPSAFSVHRFKLNGVEDLQEATRGANLQVVQLHPGPFEGNLMHAQVGSIALSAGEFGSDIRARGVMNPDLVTVGMMLETTGGVSQWDYDVMPGDIVVFPKSVEQEGRFRGYSSYVTITLSAEALAAHAAGERYLQEPEFWTKIYRFRPSPSLRNSARRRIQRRILQLRIGETPQSGPGIDFLRRSLVEAFLHGIIEESPNDREERHFPGARLVQKVEDYVDAAEANQPLHISELCSMLGVSRRSLHRAFHDTLGVGPVTYLRLRRLSSIRRVLKSAHPLHTSVTQAALDHGFSDLGRFAGYYYDIFGEKPSQTRQSAMTGSGISRRRAAPL